MTVASHFTLVVIQYFTSFQFMSRGGILNMHGCPNSYYILMKYKLFKNIHFNPPPSATQLLYLKDNSWTPATQRLRHRGGECDKETMAVNEWVCSDLKV